MKMNEIVVMEFLLKEAKERIRKIEMFDKNYGEDAYCGRDNLGRITEIRPTKALIQENMKKIRQLASNISLKY